MTTHRRRHRARHRRVDTLHSRAVHYEPTEEVLVAIEATGDERGALSVAELLARRDRINAHLIGVGNTPRDAARLTPEDSADLHAARQSRLLSRTRLRLHQAVGRGAFWSTGAALGSLVEVLSNETRKGHTRLILIPLPEVGSKRLRAADTLLAIAKAVDVPILAVPPHQELLPTRVLIATDFSRASMRAARAALSVLGPRGHVTLLHVERHASGHRNTRLLEELRHELDEEARHSSVLRRRRRSIVKDIVLLRGEPAPAILDHATTHQNDLIAVGTRRLWPGDTVPLGSVSMAILRVARPALLIAQPTDRSDVAGPTDPFYKAHHTAT